jgi:hypothetical protein
MNQREHDYDRYVTEEQPHSWSRGHSAGYRGEPFDDEGEPSPMAYAEGFKIGAEENRIDFLALKGRYAL